ncbi:unnamed protein product [Brachionus calyciflorus]|uniref:Uncharacterized protein n=1 Tax=Brachionus calyciflorus TaxID=104777 RepID=A0A813TGZ2_9BILA|nr:unnamed protein product [Brachionus calyciflorus]
MKLDFRGLENIIKCNHTQCKSKIIEGEVILLKPCYELYCSTHFQCKSQECEFCKKFQFEGTAKKSFLNICNVEKTLEQKLGKCSSCKKDHKNISEFNFENEGSDLNDFIKLIQKHKEIYKIKEPTKTSSFTTLNKKSSSTKIEGNDLGLFIKTVAEKSVENIKKEFKNRMTKPDTYKNLEHIIKDQFKDLNSDLKINYNKSKLAFYVALKQCFDQIEGQLDKKLEIFFNEFELNYHQIEKELYGLDKAKFKSLKKNCSIQSKIFDLKLRDIKSLINFDKSNANLIEFDECKELFGNFVYPVSQLYNEHNRIELECPRFDLTKKIVKAELNGQGVNVSFVTYWLERELFTELNFTADDQNIE